MRAAALFLTTLLLAPALAPHQDQAAPRPPNLILIVLDDLGWGDLGCYGNTVNETPHLDALATQGVLFERAYAAAPNCSPARAALLTGRWPARLGLTTYLNEIKRPYARFLEPEQPAGLALEETTLAEVLEANGYATGSIGKWHLGDDGFLPSAQGFKESTRGGELRERWGRKTDLITEHEFRAANAFVSEHRDEPFFLYLPLHAPHPPVTADPERIEHFVKQGAAEDAEYAAILAEVDRCLGLLGSSLDEYGLAQRTFLVVTSDNGGTERAEQAGLRGGKGKLTEGGLRVPLLVAGPGLPRGLRVRQPVSSVDLFPTVLDWLGVESPPELRLDGVSLAPLLADSPEAEPRDLFWHFPHYSADSSGRPSGAVLSGSKKLIEYYDDGSVELYDLEADPGETENLLRSERPRANELQLRLARWRAEVGAAMPSANPRHRPGSEHISEVPDKVQRRNEKRREQEEDS